MCTRSMSRRNRFPVQSVIIGIPVILLMCTIVIVTKQLKNPLRYTPTNRHGNQSISPHSIGTNTTNTTFHILTRMEWLTQSLPEPPASSQVPVPYVIIMQTTQESCSGRATCSFQVRQAESVQMDSRNLTDPGYNFLVGGDGNAYEGRGWKRIDGQVYGYNTKCIAIAFIGTFNVSMPPQRQITAAKELIEIGLKEGYIAKDYKLLGSRQVETTQSLGHFLYEDLKKWPHWSEAP